MSIVVRIIASSPQGVLLVRRTDGGPSLTGRWEFPGGRIDPDEDEYSAGPRELFEETGLRIRGALRFVARQRYRTPRGQRRTQIILAADVEGDVVLSDEHDAYQWFTGALQGPCTQTSYEILNAYL